VVPGPPSTPVKIGLFSMNTGPCSDAAGMREIAQLAEELGYDSL
jgi:hypothetical protein